jgi:hypothetical protein
MRARPEVRDGLIAFKIKRWKTMAHNPSAFGGYSVSQARKNYWRLCARYPEAGGPFKPFFGLSGAVSESDRVLLPLFRGFASSISTRGWSTFTFL